MLPEISMDFIWIEKQKFEISFRTAYSVVEKNQQNGFPLRGHCTETVTL